MAGNQQTRHSTPPIAVTMGEPAGIGAELALLAWHRERHTLPPFFVIDDPVRLKDLSTVLGLDADIETISHTREAAAVFGSGLPVLPVGMAVSYRLGIPDKKTAPAVCKSIETAARLCMDGDASAMVTAPIQKNTLYDAGFPYPGHTEFIGHLTGTQNPVMMLISPMLRVVPVTVHMPLVSAIRDLSTGKIVNTARITARSLKTDYNIQTPRIAVAGLNPHAGEDGILGREEQDIIHPAVSELQKEGLSVIGPVPPDSLFTARMRETYDVAICQYHDQALIPIKALDVDHAVNVTIGLPIVRTSPDHGTALDIAGAGKADPGSFVASLHMANEIACNRQTGRP